MPDSRVISCAACGSRNRVPLDKLRASLQPICGRCKAPLVVNTKPLTVTDATFAAEVEQSPLPVLLDLWAPWCGPCRVLAPVVEELAQDMAGRIRVAKLNVDDNPGTAARFGVRGIPTLLLLKNGQEVDRIVGVRPKTEIARHIERIAPS